MRFSVVTPTLNNEKTIKDTVFSVLNQQNIEELNYIVVDGYSTDNTPKILKEIYDDLHNKKLSFPCKNIDFNYISEKDNGMYDAIVKGFNRVTGDIMCWINGDDKYYPDSFQTVSKIFNKYSNINWVKGVTDYIEKNGDIKKGRFYIYKKNYITKGLYGSIGPYIQQDSVFWRNNMWNRSIEEELLKYKYAGDYRLWQLFSEKEQLYLFNKSVSMFRKGNNQISTSRRMEYYQEMKNTIHLNNIQKNIYKLYFKLEKLLNANPNRSKYIIDVGQL